MTALRLACFVTASMIAASASGQGKSPAGAPTPMKPGMWEIASAIESPDSTTKRTVTSRLCYAADDVAAPARVLPPQRGLGVKCDTHDVKATEPSTVTWKLACKGKGGAFTGTGTMRTTPATYTAEVRLEQKVPKPAKIDEKISGRWVGTCG